MDCEFDRVWDRTGHDAMMSLLPALLYAAGFLVLLRYPLDRAAFAALQRELAERRAAPHA